MQKSRWAPKSEDVAEASKPAQSTETAAEQTSAPQPSTAPQPAPVQASYTAPPVSMSFEPAYHDPAIDPFAQTASTDDLFFDDDIIPIAEPVVEQSPLEQQVIDAEYLPDDMQPPSAPQAHLAPHIPQGPRNPERGGRGRGRGRGARRGRGGHVGDIRETEKKAQENEVKDASPSPAPPATTEPPATTVEAETSTTAPDVPTEPKEKPTHSVRGDRTLTGGLARTRLTEDQLNAKLASMRSKNEALQTAHARAEADQANFEAREAVLKKKDVERKKVLAEKQKAERQNRQQMMGEREKNRQRKLNAQGGREWDFEKEEGFSGTGEEKRRGAARGAHGGIAPSRPAEGYQAAASSEPVEEHNVSSSARGRGRGRGGRGNRGGRGDHDGSRQTEHKKRGEQQPPSAADFPELPSSTAAGAGNNGNTPKTLDFPVKGKSTEAPKAVAPSESQEKPGKKDETERPSIKTQDSFGLPSPMEKGRSWADEVA